MSDTTPAGTDHAAAIRRSVNVLGPAVKGVIIGQWPARAHLGVILDHADALAAELAEAEAEIDRLSGMFTTIHRILDGLPADAADT